ncbi:unnamed protein product [Lactuca virosa]|uniref:Uncharacterized protein n=1 Tax=Lactuca virosa TaxID=75947 RepID=A0AAU9NDR3_9ASTR|nr:unnamed protein product [Lactuca virosa]
MLLVLTASQNPLTTALTTQHQQTLTIFIPSLNFQSSKLSFLGGQHVVVVDEEEEDDDDDLHCINSSKHFSLQFPKWIESSGHQESLCSSLPSKPS